MVSALFAATEAVIIRARSARARAAVARHAAREAQGAAAAVIARSRALSGRHGFAGSSDAAPRKTPDVRCPVCDGRVAADASTGAVDGKPAHLECWIKQREEARRAPKRSETK